MKSSETLRVVFMGTPEFAVPSLQALQRRHEVVAVVTQPDRRQGRGRSFAPPPVKAAAERLGLTVLQPERLRRRSVREQIMAFQADVFVVAAFGQILSARLLAVPPLGCINVHASLLPRYRGAAPVQWAVLHGEQESGVTIMQMDIGVDTGPILLQRGVALAEDETAGSLHDKLAPMGASLLLEALDSLCARTLSATPQVEASATLAPMLRKEDGRIDFAQPAEKVAGWVRGMDPWPGAFARLGEQTVRLFGATTTPERGEPGEVLALDDRGLLVACAADAVWLTELQLAGRRRMPAKAFAAGHPIALGTRLS